MLLLETKRKNKTLETIHFVGIGGIGMSGIADIMFNLGYKVQGSDISQNSNTKRLIDKGIKIFEGHKPENITNVSYVVISSAIKDDNPEVIAALKAGIPVIKRAQMLAELMRLKFSIAISGSHGKTTTTSLVACLFEAAGLDPTVISGGLINNKNTNAYLGSSEYLIVEADESDATFIHIPATVSVITNIDPEHMDYYKSFDNLIAAFRSFFSNLPFYGFGVACIDDKNVRSIVETIKDRKIITYGIESKEANVTANNITLNATSSSFDIQIKLAGCNSEHTIRNITLPLPGRHNVLNALAAIAIGIELDFGVKLIKEGFKKFQGVKRRFSNIGQYNGAIFIDDYAHHPTEVRATLAAAKSVIENSGGRIVAIFQPHRYSRIKALMNEFLTCFEQADQLYLTDVFAAGEEIIEGCDSLALCNKLRSSHSTIAHIQDEEQIYTKLHQQVRPGDIVLFMGAGDITNIASSVLDKLNSTARD